MFNYMPFNCSKWPHYVYTCFNERRKKEASKVKQTNKAKQHNAPNMHIHAHHQHVEMSMQTHYCTELYCLLYCTTHVLFVIDSTTCTWIRTMYPTHATTSCMHVSMYMFVTRHRSIVPLTKFISHECEAPTKVNSPENVGGRDTPYSVDSSS